jgi:hypothetical protein
MNGNEIGIDCGGPDCDPCATDGSCINGIQDGDEQYINCGGTTCPPCQDTIYWSIGADLYIAMASKTIDLTGGTFTITGTTLMGEQIGFQLPEPGVGWQAGLILTCNPDLPANQVAYQDFIGTAFSSVFPTSGVTVEILAVEANSGGIFVAEFSGSVYTADGLSSVGLQNGFVQMKVP